MLCSSYSSDDSVLESPRRPAPKAADSAALPPASCSGNNTENGATLSSQRNGGPCNNSAGRPAVAMPSLMPNSPTVKPWYQFNEKEKAMLRRSSRPIFAHLEEFGVEIYVMIFEQCPEARELFPFMKDVISVEKGKKNYSTEFSFQALRFVQILESGVNALDDLSSMDLLLHNLGRRHGKLAATNIFRPYYWSVFLECAIHKLRSYISTRSRKNTGTLSDEEEINLCIILWRRLLEGIIERMEAGFLVDIANRRSNEEQRGGANPKWKYSGSTRAGWMTASTFKNTEGLIQSFSPFKTSPLKARSRSREIPRVNESPKK